MSVFVCSQQPVPEKLQIRVNRISMAAYEALHYDKDQLKEACEFLVSGFSLTGSVLLFIFPLRGVTVTYSYFYFYSH